MIYKDFKDLKLSCLGMGAMRLPVIDNDYANIDVNAVEEMVKYAFEKGINYFDTAWGYHSGKSESVMGEVLHKYDRNSFYLASKFPGYDLANMPYVESIFEEQLKKCQVSYFDFYLFHNVCELNIDAYLDPKYGIYDYLIQQKKLGRIHHLGFSTHGSIHTMKRFLEAYGSQMEFCQIQLNYLDYDFQNASEKLKLLNEYHIPVWVMEPLRGGKLAALDENDEKALKALRPDENIPAWAFRYLQGFDEVKMILSGMSNMEQLKDNIHTFEEYKPLNEEEQKVLANISYQMTHKNTLPCTKCKYCVDHCPMGLPIPDLIELYNEHIFTKNGFIAPMVLKSYPEEKKPMACVGCKSCEKVCPQGIKISNMMKEFSELLK